MERPSTLNIQTLSGEYCDKDIVILHACFQLLTNFVEGEEAFTSHVDWAHDNEHKKAKEEIMLLYNWWSTRKILDNLNNINDLEKEQYEEDNNRLIRLIKVRQFLWT